MWSFKAVLVLLLVSLTGIELAHLNYHAQNCPKPQNFDKNFWSLYLIKNTNQFPHGGIKIYYAARFARFLYIVSALCYTAPTCSPEERAKRAVQLAIPIRIRIRSAAHLSAVERQSNNCLLHADNSAVLCHTICINDRQAWFTLTHTTHNLLYSSWRHVCLISIFNSTHTVTSPRCNLSLVRLATRTCV